MATRPTKIQVGPHPYRIVYSDSRVVRLSDDTDASYGECDTKQALITVDPSCSPSMLRDTVIHELLHAAMSLIGVGEDPGIDRDAEERIVLRLSPVLLQLVRDKRLVAWLQEET
jgi:hypothetical protein